MPNTADCALSAACITQPNITLKRCFSGGKAVFQRRYFHNAFKILSVGSHIAIADALCNLFDRHICLKEQMTAYANPCLLNIAGVGNADFVFKKVTQLGA